MKSRVGLIFSFLVFLISFFLTQAIFPALVSTFIFLLLFIFTETACCYLQWSKFPRLTRSITNLLVVTILVLSFYTLLFLPVDYQITESWKITPEIPGLYRFAFLFLFAVVLNIIDWTRLLKTKLFRLTLVFLVVVCGLFSWGYRQEKLAREYLPKIYRISPDWGIQASRIEVRGRNFFPVWKKGKLMLDDQEAVIRIWEEKLIIVELPVPHKFGLVQLYVKRSDNQISNKVSFEIKDPSYLANF